MLLSKRSPGSATAAALWLMMPCVVLLPVACAGSSPEDVASDGSAVTINLPVRVAAGASAAYTDPTGNVWDADVGFHGGVALENANQAVKDTTAPTIFDGPRYCCSNGQAAGFGYRFGVPAGTYSVTLKFTENWVTGAGQRLFNVTINGKTVLSDFDIFAESGGQWVALDKTFQVTTTSQ